MIYCTTEHSINQVLFPQQTGPMNTDTEVIFRDLVRQIPPERHLQSIGHITQLRTVPVLGTLEELQKTDGDILWTVDSGGGSFNSGIDLCSSFARSRNRVVGYVNEIARSAAFMALQGCSMRLAHPNAILQIHNPEGINFTATVRYDTDEVEYLAMQQKWFRGYQPVAAANRELMIQILLKRSHFKDRAILEGFIEGDKELSAEEAIELGFLDGIVHV